METNSSFYTEKQALELFKEKMDYAYRVASRYQMHYEDICSVTLCAVWEGIAKWNGGGALDARINFLIKNRVNDYFRATGGRSEVAQERKGTHAEKVSLDADFGDGGGDEMFLRDIIPDPNIKHPGEDMDISNKVEEILAQSKLSEKERVVTEGYYLKGYNQEELGEQLGVTGSRICQLMKSALTKMKQVALTI
jgi:RNA polymerase sigma factor (sigma-70 family)